MARRGTIFSYSIVYSATERFKDKTPYVVALVKENQRIRLALVEGYTEETAISVGMEVKYLTEDERKNPIYQFIYGF